MGLAPFYKQCKKWSALRVVASLISGCSCELLSITNRKIWRRNPQTNHVFTNIWNNWLELPTMHCEHGKLNINLVDSQMVKSFLYSGFIWLRFLKFKSNTTGTGTMETISTLQQPVWSWTTRTRTSMWRTWATPPWSPSWSSHSSSLLATSSMVWRSSKTPSSRWTILNLAHFDTFLFAANLDLAGMPHVPGERGNGHPDLVLRGLVSTSTSATELEYTRNSQAAMGLGALCIITSLIYLTDFIWVRCFLFSSLGTNFFEPSHWSTTP